MPAPLQKPENDIFLDPILYVFDKYFGYLSVVMTADAAFL
jgi:hypothetical protein